MNETQRHHDLTSDVLICLRKIIQSIDMHSRLLVREVGLTGPQLIILQQVCTSGEITASQIAKAISLSQATVTGILERLEARGFIRRTRDERDRRRVNVTCTEEGRSLMRVSPPLMHRNFIDQFAGLREWEQTMILCSLQRLVALLDARQLPAVPILASGPIESDSGTDRAPKK